MKEHPILFSGPMVRAILDGRKTMTRRAVKPQPRGDWSAQCFSDTNNDGKIWKWFSNPLNSVSLAMLDWFPCPYGQPEDWVWVRETFAAPFQHLDGPEGRTVFYRADGEKQDDGNWSPSIFMPRWASRITLEITGVRVERLWEISECDCDAEGVTLPPSELYPYINRSYKLKDQFRALWESINGKKYPWKSNPWVWVIEFKRLAN
jgi:hypothetical protein